jgi:hypothetical protein
MNDLDPNYSLPLWVSSESYERLRRESAGGPAGEAGSAAGKVTQEPSGLVLEEGKDMNDAAPKVTYWFAIWISLVRYFRAHPPLIQSPQVSSTAANAHAGKHGPYRPAAQGRAEGKVTQSPRSYLPKHLERQLPPQPSP